MHVGASLRLLLLVLLLDASPTAPGARIQGDPLLPPCGTRDPFGRALGDPMHPGAGAPSGAFLGGTVVQGDPLPRDPQGSWGSTSGMTGVQGYPLPRDPRRSLVELRVFILSAIILIPSVPLRLRIIAIPSAIILVLIELGLTRMIAPMTKLLAII